MNTLRTPTNDESLVGSFREAGGFGPPYVVLEVHEGVAKVKFPESDETATLPVAAVREDPLKR